MKRILAALFSFGLLWLLIAQVTAQAPAQPAPTSQPRTPLFAFPTNTPNDGRIPLGEYLTSLPTATPTASPSPTATATFTPTATLTPTASPTPTQPLITLTFVQPMQTTVYVNPTADLTTPEGWSCGDFPCEDDIDGFLSRIRVPAGYSLAHVGQLPGQPMQIVYGPDGRLYATVITDGGGHLGAVYAMDEAGNSEKVSADFISPVGLAFQPGTDVLYVSARVSLQNGGGIWRVESDGTTTPVLTDLPCCYQVIDNQPNGMVFGPDGYLYVGVGALTDHAEPSNPRVAQYATLEPREAAILRVQPHTGEVTVYASGIRNPYDLTFDAVGQFYATDNGLITGPGDRLLRINAGGHYGWPYYRNRGCAECPFAAVGIENLQPTLLNFPDYTLPRGLVAYTGDQFPRNLFGSLFVALWHNTPNAQRVVRIDPATLPVDPLALAEFTPEPFVTGLIRPVDVALAPDGSLVVADFIYGHVWRVSYTPDALPTTTPTYDGPIFVTSTPRQG